MEYKIDTYDFDKNLKNEIENNDSINEWPVVYMIHGKNEMYIGETNDVNMRMNQHLSTKERYTKLNRVNIISNEKFNKSAILDLEALLIEYISADGRYKLQNRNGGQSKNHKYYQKDMYLDSFENLWKQLMEKKLVNHTLEEIKNTDLFKYSPYKTFTNQQNSIVKSIINKILNDHNSNHKNFIIEGGAGTGKSILAVYLVKQLTDIFKEKNIDVNIALVVPVKSLRKTYKEVFGQIYGLKKSMVVSPTETFKKDYDILIVDEAHRLKRRFGLTNYKSFDNNNKKIKDENGTELDWILNNSKYSIFFYDRGQSVLPSDVRSSQFRKIMTKDNIYKLDTQMRVIAGDEYINFINELFKDNNLYRLNQYSIKDYDLKLFTNLDNMINSIKKLDDEYGLCRIVAGYSWDWKTKELTYREAIEKDIYDIVIGNTKLIWNKKDEDWINSENSINEVGCIHTVQGYDLNYVGVIFGKEIDYIDGHFVIYKDNYKDKKGKLKATEISLKDYEASLKEYIIKIYKVLLSRGIKGCYIYCVNPGLREYFSKAFDIASH